MPYAPQKFETVLMQKPGANRPFLVNMDEVRAFKKKGWKLVDGSAETAETVDLGSMTVEKLKDLAADANISGYETMKKAELIEALGG